MNDLTDAELTALRIRCGRLERKLRTVVLEAKSVLGYAIERDLLLISQVEGFANGLYHSAMLADILHALSHGGWHQQVEEQESKLKRLCGRMGCDGSPRDGE